MAGDKEGFRGACEDIGFDPQERRSHWKVLSGAGWGMVCVLADELLQRADPKGRGRSRGAWWAAGRTQVRKDGWGQVAAARWAVASPLAGHSASWPRERASGTEGRTGAGSWSGLGSPQQAGRWDVGGREEKSCPARALEGPEG